MKKLLHIIATPRGEQSRTLKISQAFLAEFKSRRPEWELDELNIFTEKLPELTVKNLEGKYELLIGHQLSAAAQAEWQGIIEQIERFKSADGYLLTVPMWNFTIPYRLKHYLDVIVQPKYLFEYTETGAEGLINDKKMVIITSRGGDYTIPAFKHLDLQEPYLRNLWGFVGFRELLFINAQPMDAMGEDVRELKLSEACSKAVEAADWI